MTNLFLKVNKDLFKLGLNPTEILVLAQIMEFNTNTNDCFISNKVLAEQFGVSEKTIARAIEALEKKGYITRNTKNVKGGKERHMLVNTKNLEAQLTKDNLSVDSQDDVSTRDKMTIDKGQNDFCTKDNLTLDKGQNDSIKDNIKDNIKEKDKDITESFSAGALKEESTAPKEIEIDGVKAQPMTREEAMEKFGLSACASSIPTRVAGCVWINKNLVQLI